MNKSPETLVDSRRLSTVINQRIKKNCTYQIEFSEEDFEKRGNAQKLTPEAQERILGEYRTALEISKKSMEDGISSIGGDMNLLQEKKQTTKQYSKDDRKTIKVAWLEAARNWEGVQGNKNNPEYNKYFREYEAANDEHNAMIATDATINSIDDTFGGLSNQQKNLQDELGLLIVDELCEILSRELEDISLEETVQIETPIAKKHPKNIGSITKKVGLFATGIIALGVAVRFLPKDNKDTTKTPQAHQRVTNSSVNASTAMLSELNHRSILACLTQLEKHGNLQQFQEKIMQELHKN